jgi:Protein of unknown function (DUF3352)
MQRRTDATVIALRSRVRRGVCAPAGVRPLRGGLAALVLAAIAALACSCGSSHSSGTKADPASAVPASAPLYASAVVRPEGSLKTAAQADGQTVTHERDPYLHLLQVLQTPGSPPLDFERDIAPWLGPEAGAFLSALGSSGEASLGQLLSALEQGLLGGSSATSAFPFAHPAAGSGGGQGALVLDTSNVGKARAFLETQARRAGAHPASYRNVSYQVSSGGIAFGIVGRFAVIGSESGLRGVIDTTLGGPSLVHTGPYSQLLASAPPGTLAHLYANPAAGAAGAAGGPVTAGLVGALAGARPANLSLVPASGSVTVDADSLTSGAAGTEPSRAGGPGGLLSSLSEGAPVLAELPGESWLGVGLGNAGATLGTDVRGLRALLSFGGSLTGSALASPAVSFGLKDLLEGVLTPLGVLGAETAEARTEFRSWMESAGIFASGSGLLELRAAVVIASNNSGLSRAAVERLGEQLRKAGGTITPASIPGTEASIGVRLPGVPVVLTIASGPNSSGQSRFVLGLGEASVTDALHPPTKLAGSAELASAATTLGEGIQPSLMVDPPTFLGLLEAVGLTANPSISKLVPYVRSIGTVVGGGKSLAGGIDRFRLVLKLQPTA